MGFVSMREYYNIKKLRIFINYRTYRLGFVSIRES